MSIRLIISDLDGCINPTVGAPFDLAKMARLKEAIAKRGIPFTFCTGRPKPYLEAVMQMLGIRVPAVCENGGIIFDPKTLKMIYPAPKMIEMNRPIIETLKRSVLPGLPAFIEPSKQVAIGIIPHDISDTVTTSEIVRRINSTLHLFPCKIHFNIASNVVNVLPDGISKDAGVTFLLELLGIDANDALAVGDSHGDASFMRLCGKKACPANSDVEVKELSDIVSLHDDIDGMLDILASS